MRIQIKGLWERIHEAFNHLSVPQIAKELGISKQSVYGWRDGEVPWLDNLIRISESTDTSLHWLLTGEGPKRRSELKTLAENGQSAYSETKPSVPIDSTAEDLFSILDSMIEKKVTEYMRQHRRESQGRIRSQKMGNRK